MKNLVTTVLRKYAPVFEGWGKDRCVSDFRDNDFVDTDLFSDFADAKRYAESNRGNYPYCTTGQVALVEVTVKPIKIVTS